MAAKKGNNKVKVESVRQAILGNSGDGILNWGLEIIHCGHRARAMRSG